MNDDELIPIAALNHYAYCPHRCWRMFCLGEFQDNAYTIEGTGLHERVHTLGTGSRGDTRQIRAIWLRSERYGLIGKADVIEECQGIWCPVETKRGPRGDWENDAMQVCGQALCLEDLLGVPITYGAIYYAQTHQRQAVNITPELRHRTLEVIELVRDLLQTGKMPAAIYGPRCRGCSLVHACLPQAAKKMKRYQEME